MSAGGGPEQRPRRPLRRRRPRAPVLKGPARATANICQAASCLSARSDQVLDGLADQVTGAGLTDVAVRRVGCLGLCAAGPLVEVPETGRLFERVDPGDLGGLVEALAAVAPDATLAPAAPFFARQVRVATENSGRVDPEDLDDYRAHGGYRALVTALQELTPAEVVDQVVRSGLRGRGGAGYPTGLKWTTVAKAPGSPKYVICNADEGDPGAFMDRSVLESDPHRVLEGMAIAGYAVGASRGYVYCRAEYPLAVARLRTAIRLAGRAGLLGAGIADTPFEFHVELRLGAGAFVCGEETALIASVQGGRGTPMPRPPTRPPPGCGGARRSSTTSRPWPASPPSSATAATGTHGSAPLQPRHQGVRAGRAGGQHRPGRGADGHHPARDRLRHRRRHPRRPPLQGRPDRWAVRRLHPRAVPGHAGRLRVAEGGRVDHGLGRHDRDGRQLLHGRCGPLLHGLLPRGVLRQVHPLPGRHHPAPHAAATHLRRRRLPGRPGAARAAVGHGQGHQPVRPGPERPQPGVLDPALLPRGVPGPHPGPDLPGRGLPGRRSFGGSL